MVLLRKRLPQKTNLQTAAELSVRTDRMLLINNYQFEIRESEFSCYIYRGEHDFELRVNLDFRTECKELDDFDWEFHIYTHSLNIKLPSLEMLPGSEFDISNPIDDEPQMCIYSYTHEPISNGKIRFLKWSGTSIEFNLSGFANFWDEAPFEGDIEISIDYLLPFNGVTIDEPNSDKAKDTINKFMNIKYFLDPELDATGKQSFRLSGEPKKS